MTVLTCDLLRCRYLPALLALAVLVVAAGGAVADFSARRLLMDSFRALSLAFFWSADSRRGGASFAAWLSRLSRSQLTDASGFLTPSWTTISTPLSSLMST